MKRVKLSEKFKAHKIFIGFDEGDPDPEAGGQGGAGGDEEDDSSDDDDEEDDEKPDDTAGLKSALQKERELRRAAEKREKKLQREKSQRDQKDLTEVQRAQEAETAEKNKVSKLAEKLLTQSVEAAITKAAQAAKFRDPSDAIALISRSDLTVDQDEDDPSEIDIDETSVTAAVKALAAKKPHLILADGDEVPSGSQFGGSRKGTKKADEEALKTKYTSLA